MIKIMVVTNSDKVDVIKPGTATPREVFDELNVNYGMSVVNLNSRRLTGSELDMTFADLGVTEDCYLTSVVKADNAVTAKVEGSAVIITSSLKREDIELAAKYRPESLKVYDGDGKDRKLVFAVAAVEGTGDIGKFGACFGKNTNAEGNAVIALLFDDVDDPAAELEEYYGSALLNIEKVEAVMADVIEDIHAEQAKIRSKITVA